MTINPSHHYRATVISNRGTFTIQLLPRLAPIAVNSFVFLARHRYFDHNLFHRIIRDMMIQSGDPTGTGAGGPGYTFQDELPPKTMKYTVGTVAMANLEKPNTNGSQFFIVTGPEALSLGRNYTIFGRVSSGMNVVYKIANTPITANPALNGEPSEPLVDVYIKSITIHETR